MGVDIQQESFSDEEFQRFEARLRRCLQALSEVVARPGFGVGAASIGAELELCLVDEGGRALPLNRKVLEQAGDDRLCLELANFNLESNARPAPLEGRPFSALGRDLEGSLGQVREAAARFGGRIAAIGILPTLHPDNLTHSLTDRARYRALSRGMRARRHRPFEVKIDGAEPLTFTSDDVAMCGAATSFQLHLKVAPAAFAHLHNAAQLALAPALAAAGNAPTFLGHKLWHETRIALFAEGVDDRNPRAHGPQLPRVGFGHGWCREGIVELFASDVALHPPLLPICAHEDPLEVARAGGVPELSELRLHHGTIYPWNRGVYDPAGGGHLRIEFRPLPAGPTVVDMLANAAFLLGLTLGLAPEIERLLPAIPFEFARRSFLRAARQGLSAELFWPAERAPSPRPIPAPELVGRLLPTARSGLLKAGVEAGEIDPLLAIVEARVASGQTGAVWQLRTLEQLEGKRDREAALFKLLERYMALSEGGEPVHGWQVG